MVAVRLRDASLHVFQLAIGTKAEPLRIGIDTRYQIYLQAAGEGSTSAPSEIITVLTEGGGAGRWKIVF